MNIKREGLAAIYSQADDGNYLQLRSVALVEINNITKNFVITSGKYKGRKNSNFNRIIGSEDFIFKDNINLTFLDNKRKKSIYIITNDYINNYYQIGIKTSIYDIYLELAQRLSGVLLIKEKNKLTSLFSYIHYLHGSFSKKQIDEMFDIEDTEEIIEDHVQSEDNNNNQTLVLPFGMQMLVSLSEKSKEMNEEKVVDSNVVVNNNENININNINVNDIINDINSKIIGQEKAVKTLVTNIFYNQVLIDSLSKDNSIDYSELDSRKVSILLDGSTGTGKTAILKEIASKLELPIDIVNANSFSETGYIGPTITDILSRLLNQANGNIELAQRGIIVLDEIDKIASPDTYDTRDMKKGVQEELLSFIGGGKYDVSQSNGIFKTTIPFDTSKITFILSGAFTKLRDNKIKEQEKKFNGMGFNGGYNSSKNEYEITSQDYIDYGLMREFFGRIKVLTSTKSYSIDDLKKILLESKISPLKNLEKTVKMFGYSNLNYNDDFINTICDEAYKLDTGARGLQSIMSGIQNKILIDLINKTYNLDEPINIDSNILSEYKKDNIRTYTRKKN